jgi:hypothetical protein
MRFLISGLAFLVVTGAAMAEAIPTAIEKSLKSFQPVERTLSDGILRIRLGRSVLSNEVFRSVVLSMCRPLVMSVSGDKSGWGKTSISRIEVVNQIGAQGFAYVGGKRACGELEQFTSAEVNAKAFAKNT